MARRLLIARERRSDPAVWDVGRIAWRPNRQASSQRVGFWECMRQFARGTWLSRSCVLQLTACVGFSCGPPATRKSRTKLNETVGQLKLYIEEQLGIFAGEQHLMFHSQVLEDDRVLGPGAVDPEGVGGRAYSAIARQAFSMSPSKSYRGRPSIASLTSRHRPISIRCSTLRRINSHRRPDSTTARC